MSKFKAFSIIELLVIVAIIAILSAIAVPTYGTYVVKARVSELLTVAEGYKVKLIENAFLDAGQMQTAFNLNTETIDRVQVHTIAGNPSKHIIQVVAKMQTADHRGIGLVQPANSDAPLTIQLQGVENGSIISWSCHVAVGYNQYVPNNCNNNELAAIET